MTSSDPHDPHGAAIDALITTLSELMGPESESAESAVLVVTALRMLMKGQPVNVADLTDRLAWSDQQVNTTLGFLDQTSQLSFDESARLTAVAGLSLSPTQHSFRVCDVELYTWCAIDTLFLPTILGETATIASRCPTSGEIISLRVSPVSGIDGLSHPDTMVSIVNPRQTTSESVHTCRQSAPLSCAPDHDLFGENGAFCGSVYFFGSMSNASFWHSTHPGAVLLPLEVAHHVAVTAWAEPLLTKAR